MDGWMDNGRMDGSLAITHCQYGALSVIAAYIRENHTEQRSKKVSKKSIYIAHHRETSNALKCHVIIQQNIQQNLQIP